MPKVPAKLAWKPTTRGEDAYTGTGTYVDVMPVPEGYNWHLPGWVAVLDFYSGEIPKFIDASGRQDHGTVAPHSRWVHASRGAAKAAAAKYVAKKRESVGEWLRANPKAKARVKPTLEEALRGSVVVAQVPTSRRSRIDALLGNERFWRGAHFVPTGWHVHQGVAYLLTGDNQPMEDVARLQTFMKARIRGNPRKRNPVDDYTRAHAAQWIVVGVTSRGNAVTYGWGKYDKASKAAAYAFAESVRARLHAAGKPAEAAAVHVEPRLAGSVRGARKRNPAAASKRLAVKPASFPGRRHISGWKTYRLVQKRDDGAMDRQAIFFAPNDDAARAYVPQVTYDYATPRWLEVARRTEDLEEEDSRLRRGRRRNPAAYTVGDFLTVLSSKLTQHDAKENVKHYNLYRLGHLLEAANKVRNDVRGVVDSSTPAAFAKLKAAIAHRFTLPFAPASAVVRQIDAYLATGKKPSLV